MVEDPPPLKTEFTVSWATLLKLMLALLLAMVAIALWPLVIPLLLALVIALTLHPLLAWTERHRWPRWTGLLLCGGLLFGLVALFIGILIPTFTTQGAQMIEKMPAFKADLIQRLPQHGGWRDSADRMLNAPTFSNPEPFLKNFMAWGGMALDGIAKIFIILIFAIYFVADGRRTYEWLIAFLPPEQRQKVAEAAPEFASVVGHYVFGQAIVSTCTGVFVFTVLSLFHVPSGALLAVLAAILDVIPVVGITISSLLAVALSLTVSASTAVWVAILYGIYHLLEDYLIFPKVYGNRLRISALVVLLSCFAAILVLGYVGAVLVLPLVASYPIVERIWLRPFLERDTVRKHQELQKGGAEKG